MLRLCQPMRSGNALMRMRAPLSIRMPLNAAPALLLTGHRDASTLPLAGRAILSQNPNTPCKKSILPSRGLSTSGAAPITEGDVLDCQDKWAFAICHISKVYKDGGDFVGTAGEHAGELYGYGHTDVLFKPTKATKHPFRPTPEDAMSYFVGSLAMNNEKFFGEDGGFAINGGRGWSKVVFSNHNIQLFSDCAIAMGSYDFTDATSRRISTVEYTFGYRRNDDGKLRIFLHHSSVPFSPTAGMM